MTDIEVSWCPEYNIHIKHIDGNTAYHLREALKKYLAELRSQDDDVIMDFERIMGICETINEAVDED